MGKGFIHPKGKAPVTFQNFNESFDENQGPNPFIYSV
jgi:hypothetical protein